MNSKYNGKFIPYLLLLPSILISFIFLYYPAVQSFILSLYKTAFLGIKKIYVGPENFLELLSSRVYLDSILMSIIFAGSVVVIGISVSMFIAILLNRDIPGTQIYRLGFIWPYALSPAVAGVILLFMFNPTAGIVNYITETLWGISPDWVSNSKLALVMVIGAAIWKNLGYNIVFYLASLQNIPDGVMEAAAVDGANNVQRFFYITFSFLKPTTLFLVITNLIYSFFDTFGIIETLTKGGPVNATNIMIYNLYTDAFKNLKSGVAAAQSIILFFLVMIFTIVQFKWSDKKIHYGG
ncbi:sugar ABC transporter permease [Halocella sp. SP3-1]|uniref:carbohydrate ABC transporter permease n=1 Tax=Halocella sp. SP3-1 TaxID=2382161 RepID=UPI000F75BA73|nr:sugar ABC transporter permease [Halocella sp. SP3-1]AZO93643.1 sugar ABC transporter permease [Halocella sp. SP3-1]